MAGAVDELTIDGPTRAALARLTDNEKACLRRRLLHQTAKEMALELGISPHAVEKRLKMARTKLGLSSSLETARLLARFEQYQQAGPQSPDLASGRPQRQTRRTTPLVIGGIAMGTVAATLVVIAAFASSSPERAAVPEMSKALGDETAGASAAGAEPITEHFPRSDFVKATPAEILVIVQNTFHALDKDHSGFLEDDESPMIEPAGGSPVYKRDKNGNAVPTGEVVHRTLAQLRKIFYAQADTDRDGKVSFEEYRRWEGPGLARQGIPAEWKADINRPVPTDLPSSPDPG